ncbi:GSCOCG00012591001-RA-CDS, partial [Cotesia congregata]
ELIVLRRPRNHVRTIEKTPSDFAFCPSCKVLTSKKFLSAHFASCSGQTGKHRRIIKKISKIYENDFHPDTCKKLRRLIAHMHVDEASKTLKYDYLLIHYGNMLCDKYKNPQTDELIRNRLRLLARLLNTVKAVEAEIIKKKKSNRQIHSKTPVTDMISLFDPENVKICIKAVNILAGIDKKTYDSKAPSVASSCGQFLKHLGDFLMSENIMEKKKSPMRISKTFYML